jgi:hypothetical protein
VAAFRDVFEVNGVPIRDREERLKKLFLESPATAMAEARRITDESARYNIGNIERNVNVPTLPLLFLQPANRWRFAFRKHSEDVVDGIHTWRIDYSEQARPTFINRTTGGELPVTGSFWVDPMNGRILKTLVRTDKGALKMSVTVVYKASETLGIWVPSEMREQYESNGWVVEGQAAYSNFRRFRVLTEEQIKIPKISETPDPGRLTATHP